MYIYTQEDDMRAIAEGAARRMMEEYLKTNETLEKQLEIANAEIDRLKAKRCEKDRKSQAYKLGKIEGSRQFADKLKLAFFLDEEIVNKAWVNATYHTDRILKEFQKSER